MSREFTTGQISTIQIGAFHICKCRLRDWLAASFNPQRHSGTSETDLPRFRPGRYVLHHPGIEFSQVEMRRISDYDSVKRFLVGEKPGHREIRLSLARKEEPRDIDTGEV